MTTQDEANEAQRQALLSQHDATGAQREATDAQGRVTPSEIAIHETAKTQAWIRRLATITAGFVIALGAVSSFYSIRGDIKAAEGRAGIRQNTEYLIQCTTPAPKGNSLEALRQQKLAEEGKRCYERNQAATNAGPVMAIINENDRRVCIRFEQAFGQLAERNVVNPPLVFDCTQLIPPLPDESSP